MGGQILLARLGIMLFAMTLDIVSIAFQPMGDFEVKVTLHDPHTNKYNLQLIMIIIGLKSY